MLTVTFTHGKMWAMKEKKPRMGRPPLPSAQRRNIQLTVSVTKKEEKELRAEAGRRGKTISELLLEPWRK